MDKGLHQQQQPHSQQQTPNKRNDRSHRKLVRSSEHSWFGDIRLSPATSRNASSENQNESINSPESVDVNAHPQKKACSKGNTTTTDNKTIRRLEFFTSLQKQLMSSIGRRSASHESSSPAISSCTNSSSSSSNNSGIKRNASCRHHNKSDKLDKSGTMSCSYSSASLASSATLMRHLSPTHPTPTSLSGIIESTVLDQESNNINGTNSRLHLSPTELISVTTNHLHHTQANKSSSPLSDTHIILASNSITHNTINQTIMNNDAASLSKSVPNTLMLSPTNPFFSSLEQHLLDSDAEQRNTNPNSSTEDETTQKPFFIPSSNHNNKNPFLYDTVNNSTRNIDDSNNVQIGFAVIPSTSCSKREEFLKATLKICLVVSPPSNKFQVSFIVNY